MATLRGEMSRRIGFEATDTFENNPSLVEFNAEYP